MLLVVEYFVVFSLSFAWLFVKCLVSLFVCLCVCVCVLFFFVSSSFKFNCKAEKKPIFATATLERLRREKAVKMQTKTFVSHVF